MKYMSKIFNDDWMRDNGFLDEQPGLGTAKDVLRAKPTSIVTASATQTVGQVIESMKTLGISQLPVLDDGKIRGLVTEVGLLRHLIAGQGTTTSPIASLVESDYATVSPDTKIELLQGVIADAKIALVTEGEKLVGVITKIDLIEFLANRKASLARSSRAASVRSNTRRGRRPFRLWLRLPRGVSARVAAPTPQLLHDRSNSHART
jgi:cystathionine beta-synthase